MNGLDEHGTVSTTLLHVTVTSAHNLPLEDLHHLLYVTGTHQVHRHLESLFADVNIGRRECPEKVHEYLLQHLRVVLLKLGNPFEHNQLDVVVGLRVEETRVGGSRRTHRRGGGGEGDEGPRRLVRHGGAGGVEHREERADETGLLGRVAAADLAGELKDTEAETIAIFRYVIDMVSEVIHRHILRLVEKEEEGVAPRRGVGLRVNERLNQLRPIRQQTVTEAFVNVEDAQCRIFTHERVTVVEALLDGRDQRIKELGLAELTEKPQHRTTHVLIGVPEVDHEGVTHEHHLSEQLVLVIILRSNLPV
mmetsp:Transcript_23670/g.54579  ORF Transcript_23670/g.54579 Transcript_23670/m.54579 type:complete len:307 (-) Transcript_23670:280-1200(-)